MKKINLLLLIALFMGLMLNAQSNVHISGKGDRPLIAKELIRLLSDKNFDITYDQNDGYGTNGSWSRIYINNIHFKDVQFSNEMVNRLRFVLDKKSSKSAKSALEACVQQYNVLHETAIKASGKASRDETNDFSEEKESKLNFDDIDTSGDFIFDKKENKENFGIINVPKNQRLVIKTPLTSLSKFPEPSGKFEILTKAQKCALLLEENQSLIEIYQRNQKLSTFDRIPDNMALKKCLTGKTWAGRNMWWLAPLAGALVFTGIDYFSNYINVLFGNNSNDGGTTGEPNGPHTNPRILEFNSPVTNLKEVYSGSNRSLTSMRIRFP